MHIVAEVQKEGGVAAFVDAEHALDPDRAKAVGVKIDKLLISQPDNGEQALDIVEALVRSNSVDIIVVDSVAALTPRRRRSKARWAIHIWVACQTDEPGAAQAYGDHFQVQMYRNLHKPDPNEDRSNVWQS
jgi:RecA/RadA recombinase